MIAVYDPSLSDGDGVKVIVPVVPLPEMLHVPETLNPEALVTAAPFSVEEKLSGRRASARVKVTALGAVFNISLFVGVVVVTLGGVVSRTTVRVTGRLLNF